MKMHRIVSSVPSSGGSAALSKPRPKPITSAQDGRLTGSFARHAALEPTRTPSFSLIDVAQHTVS
jgi:hypothetical protein